MDSYDKALQECRGLLSRDPDVEMILRLLRDRGVSKTFSIRALAELGITDLNKAKALVHESKTWSDVRGRDERFHDSIDEALRSK